MEKLKYEKPVINKITAGIPNKFGLPTKQKIISEIDGISIDRLMDDYGSPLFVISERTIRETFTGPARHSKPVTQKYNLPGRIKPITSMPFAAFFTTMGRGPKWFRDLNSKRHLPLA
jgi:hypothetical protein